MKNLLFVLLPQNSARSDNFLSLISSASLMVKLVLLLLLFFSIVSWAIIIFKLVEYSKAKRNSLEFMEYFKKTKNFAEINKYASLCRNNPLAEVFRNGYRELSIQSGPDYSTRNINLESINRSLAKASNIEITRLERLNGFLATTAAVTPFVGLFGTVWGIMNSFQEIGLQMNANLATVAPGIAEALIATALGLFAAIPAVIFYNLLLNKLKVIISNIEDFTLEFLNVSEKLQ